MYRSYRATNAMLVAAEDAACVSAIVRTNIAASLQVPFVCSRV